MASACINNIPTTPTPYSSYGWLSPRISLSREFNNDEENKILKPSSPKKISPDLPSSANDAGDFEFRLADNVTMLSADELFPMQFFPAKSAPPPPEEEVKSPGKISEDLYLFSPKAPRCSGRWRELLGLRKLNQINSQSKTMSSSSSSAASSTSSSSIKLFLNRNSKTSSSSSVDPSLSLPLLKDSPSSSSSLEYESISLSSSRLSLSSSSSGHDHDEIPRLSLGAEKPISLHHRSLSSGPKVRTVRPKMENLRVGRSPIQKETTTTTTAVTTRGVSVDSPRMNPSGKVVFQSLERSSSSPSSFNGGPRYKQHNNRGIMERSYSANVHVRITPVLNVPVCSLRGSSKSGGFRFGQLFSSSSSLSQKKEGNCNNASNGSTRSNHHHPHTSGRNKKEKEKK